MEQALKRIKLLVSSKFGNNVSAFARSIDMPQVTVNDYLLGKRKMSFALIFNLIRANADISAEWLLRGEGEMLKTTGSLGKVSNDIENTFPCENDSALYEELLDQRDKRIRELELEVLSLKRHVNDESDSE